MECSICKQPKADITVNGKGYHTECYMEKHGLPKSTVKRILGKKSSHMKKARLTTLMREGIAEYYQAREIDYYKQRRPLPGQPDCYRMHQDHKD